MNPTKMREALEQIAQWDMLNPVQPDRIADLQWLKDLVTSALTPAPTVTPAQLEFLKAMIAMWANKPDGSGMRYKAVEAAAIAAVQP
jgi:hypothetical protein